MNRKTVTKKLNETKNSKGSSPSKRSSTPTKIPPLERRLGGVSNTPSKPTSKKTHSRPNKKRRKIIPYDPKLKERARNLRNNCTRSEAHLWKQLKGKFAGKYDFHRQKPLGYYIADFFCYELRLVIELDGITHEWEETKKKDLRKEKRLNQLGLNVLRFKDEDVFENLDGVIDVILKYVDGFEGGDLGVFVCKGTPLNPLSRGDFCIGEW